jgi:nicotinamide riboside kinase
MPEALPKRAEAKADAIRIAIVGAESTGKTTLAAALAPRLATDTGLRVAWVPEWLREWCQHTGRTPQVHEQAAILRGQHERIEEAAAQHDIVVCDTTPLMIAVYSRLVFGDRSLDERAAQLHARMALTLLTALDLPWVADGLFRDGPQVQEPVDTMLRELLLTYRLPWALVGGSGAQRLENAVDALAPLLRPRGAPGRGLFTRLDERNAEHAARAWRCENCDDPGCEHRLLLQRR